LRDLTYYEFHTVLLAKDKVFTKQVELIFETIKKQRTEPNTSIIVPE
jgi:hypothetical protein